MERKKFPYRWSVVELEGIGDRAVTECPPGQEAAWLHWLWQAQAEARFRLDMREYPNTADAMMAILEKIKLRIVAAKTVFSLAGQLDATVTGKLPSPDAFKAKTDDMPDGFCLDCYRGD